MAVRRYVRVVAVVVPLLAGLADAAATVSIVAEGRRCAVDCTSGVVLVPFAPALSPLGLAGIGVDDAEQPLAAVVVAYTVIVALTAAWWWFVGGLLVRWCPSWPAIASGLVAAAMATALVKVPALAIEARAGPWGQLAVEAGTWALLSLAYRRLWRRQHPDPTG